MKIAIGSDHAGFQYKEEIKKFLEAYGHEVIDFGTHAAEPMVDYPLYIHPTAFALTQGNAERAIVLGGSGNGEAMVANRIPGVRCALCWSEQTAEWARRHNDSNCLSIGERTVTLEQALQIVKIWLETPFDGGRHARRIAEIEEISAQGN